MHKVTEMNDFYRLLDREIKKRFLMDTCDVTGWKKSTFYTRLGGRSNWTEAEMIAVYDLYLKYKSKYII